MSIVGRMYLERGQAVTVTVICGWGKGGGPRNVWIRRQDGTEVVRPFRGLRKPKPQTETIRPGAERTRGRRSNA